MRLVASTPPIGVLLHTLADAPMTSLVAALPEISTDEVRARWDAYWDLSDPDEPYYLHARDSDTWYRVDPEDDVEADVDAAGGEALGTGPTAAPRAAPLGLAGRWFAGETTPRFCFVRQRRTGGRTGSRTGGASVDGENFMHATTAAVVAAAVESLVNSPRVSLRAAARWRAVNVRLDAG
jgi:hypothetical protein